METSAMAIQTNDGTLVQQNMHHRSSEEGIPKVLTMIQTAEFLLSKSNHIRTDLLLYMSFLPLLVLQFHIATFNQACHHPLCFLTIISAAIRSSRIELAMGPRCRIRLHRQPCRSTTVILTLRRHIQMAAVATTQTILMTKEYSHNGLPPRLLRCLSSALVAVTQRWSKR